MEESSTDNNQQAWNKLIETRYYRLAFGTVQSFLTAGLMYGWPSLAYVIRNQRMYSSVCTEYHDSNDGSLQNEGTCTDEEIYIGLIYQISFLFMQGTLLPAGIILDKFGPRINTIIGFSFCILGGMILSLSSILKDSFDFQPNFSNFWRDPLLIGVTILSLGGSFVHLSQLSVSKLFPNSRSMILTYFVGVYASSAYIFLILEILFLIFPSIPLSALFVIYTIVMLVASPTLFYHPVQYPKVAISSNSTTDNNTINSNAIVSIEDKSLWQDVCTLEWVLITVMVAVNSLFLSFYIGSGPDFLIYLSHRVYPSDAAAQQSAQKLYITLMTLLTPLGAPSVILIGWVIEKKGLAAAVGLLLFLSTGFNVVALVPNLPLQILGYLFWPPHA